jgi:hypothetical protein
MAKVALGEEPCKSFVQPRFKPSGMVGRLFSQLGVPPDALRRYAVGSSGGSGGGSGSGSGDRAAARAAAAAGAAVAGAGAGRHLRKEAWFRGVADPTGEPNPDLL